MFILHYSSLLCVCVQGHMNTVNDTMTEGAGVHLLRGLTTSALGDMTPMLGEGVVASFTASGIKISRPLTGLKQFASIKSDPPPLQQTDSASEEQTFYGLTRRVWMIIGAVCAAVILVTTVVVVVIVASGSGGSGGVPTPPASPPGFVSDSAPTMESTLEYSSDEAFDQSAFATNFHLLIP